LKRRARWRGWKCPQIGAIHELTKPELFQALPRPLMASAVSRLELMADKQYEQGLIRIERQFFAIRSPNARI
jgi:hypothetical protein